MFQGASEDGSKVFFTSEQELLTGARGDSLYEYDFNAAHQHERLTLLAPEVERVAASSEDGGRVYFQSSTVLTGAANGNGETAEAGKPNLYVYDTDAGDSAFVAQEASVGGTTRDGALLVFTSGRHVAHTNDTSGVAQIFEYEAEAGRIARVSVGQTSPTGYECEATHVVEAGFNCDGNATSGGSRLPYSLSASEGSQWAPTDATSGLAVAADGTVEFESTIPLTPLAVAGQENVYEYRNGDVYLISPGTEAVPAVLPGDAGDGATRALGISESAENSELGQGVFFATTEALVPQDVDGQTSWYDARVQGGFPAPAASPACEGETCQGPVPATPVVATPGSNVLTGSGNLAPPTESNPGLGPAVRPSAKPTAKPCKKGFVRRKGKCIRASKSKKAKKAGIERGSK